MIAPRHPNPIVPDTRAYTAIRKLLRWSLWTDSLKVMAVMVRNAVVIVACVWMTNGCFALGNIFSRNALNNQSSCELVVANMSWFAFWYTVLLLASHVPALRSLHFIANPDQHPALTYCVKRLISGSYPYMIVTFVLSFCMGILAAHFSLSKYKLGVYLAVLCSAVFSTGIGLTFRKLFFLETCEGRERRLLRHSATRQPELVKGAKIRSVIPLSSDQIPQYRPLRYWPVYLKVGSETLGLLFFALYVHIVSRQRFSERGVTWFMVGSALVKLALQEMVKFYVLKTRLRDMRTICVLVSLPTVMIDTQTRILLLDLQNTHFVLASTLGMAVVEIVSRVTKAVWLAWNIQQRENALLRSTQGQQNPQAFAINDETLLNTAPGLRHEFNLWHQKCHAYHTAELNADMYAEYIAIGCSASVLFFLGGNPHYSRLGIYRNELTSGNSSIGEVAWRNGQLIILVFQAVVEVAVDYISVVFELANGVQFGQIKELSSFFGVMFMTIAFLNIMATVMVYLD